MTLEVPTYESLVARAKCDFDRRVAELKQAEQLIREIRGDLEAITAAKLWLETSYGFDVSDGKTPDEIRRRPALRLRLSLFQDREETKVRLLNLLLERGWEVAYAQQWHSASDGNVILRKSKIRARIDLALPGFWFDAQDAVINAEQPHVV